MKVAGTTLRREMAESRTAWAVRTPAVDGELRVQRNPVVVQHEHNLVSDPTLDSKQADLLRGNGVAAR